MNNDAEAINQFLAWLLQTPNPVSSQPSGTASGLTAGHDYINYIDSLDHCDRDDLPDPIDRTGTMELQPLDPLDSEQIEALAPSQFVPNQPESGSFPFEESSLFNSGERPAVQDRFYSLIKHRLRAEIERNPPRFPWETEALEYEEQSEAVRACAPINAAPVWAAQLQALSLPVPMSDALLTQLFIHCQSVVESSLKEGAKLVQAVADLFPNKSTALNQLAGLVLTTPYRGGSVLPQADSQPDYPSQSGFPTHYDQATEPQQMALSLIAARTILDATTFRLSVNQPKLERQWQTAIGLLTLEADYTPQDSRVRISGQLPGQGSLYLKGKLAAAIAQCANPGELSVELSQLEPNQTYSLTVHLEDTDQPPLVFAVCPVTEN
jgi:hypothetical protein